MDDPIPRPLKLHRPAAFLRFLPLITVVFSCCALVWAWDLPTRNHNYNRNNRRESSETVQKLVLGLQSQSKNDQLRAAQALGEIGSAAEQAVPALVKVIKTGSPEARVVSSIALLKIDPTMKDMIPILLHALEKEKTDEQEVVLSKELGLQEDALQKWSSLMRSKVDPAILPLLVQALKEDDKDIRILGVLVLGSIATRLSEALPYVLQAYGDPDKEVRGAVLGTLSRIGPEAKGVVPVILNGMKDPEADVRLRAMLAMGRLGPGVKEVIPALLKGLEDKDPQVRAAALKVLGSFGPAAKEVAPTVAARTGRGGPEERLAAAAALLKIDSAQAGRVVPLLVLLLQDPLLELPLRLRAADLLEQSGFAAAREITDLMELLADSNAQVRNRVVQLLSGMGSAAVPALTRSMQNANGSVRLGAVQALIGMQPLPPELVPFLAAALEDKDRSIRYLAAEGLGNLGVLAKSAIPALIQALRDPEESVRTSAGNALSNMGSSAVPALTEVSRDPVIGPRAQVLLKRIPHESP